MVFEWVKSFARECAEIKFLAFRAFSTSLQLYIIVCPYCATFALSGCVVPILWQIARNTLFSVPERNWPSTLGTLLGSFSFLCHLHTNKLLRVIFKPFRTTHTCLPFHIIVGSFRTRLTSQGIDVPELRQEAPNTLFTIPEWSFTLTNDLHTLIALLIKSFLLSTSHTLLFIHIIV